MQFFFEKQNNKQANFSYCVYAQVNTFNKKTKNKSLVKICRLKLQNNPQVALKSFITMKAACGL